MKNKLVTLSGLVLGFAPVVAFAQVGNQTICNSNSTQDVGWILCKLSQILGQIVPVLVALAIVYFVWGIISYVIADDEEAKSTGRNRIIAGIIGLAVIISVWGLVRILTNTFRVDNGGKINLPIVPYGN